MSRGVLGKNNWALVLLILVGVVLGGDDGARSSYKLDFTK